MIHSGSQMQGRLQGHAAGGSARIGLQKLCRPGSVSAHRTSLPMRMQHCGRVQNKKEDEAVERRLQETSEEALERRMRESAQVEDRVTWVDGLDQLKDQMRAAGDRLVILELQRDGVCEAGLDAEPEAELQWKGDAAAAQLKRLDACRSIKHTFARTARECEDVVFLTLAVPEGPEGQELQDILDVQVLPAIAFYKEGVRLWQQQGYQNMEEKMGEGVLWYGDSAAGLHASDFVRDLGSKEEYYAFVNNTIDPDMLTIVDVSTDCQPCMKVFPAVLALAKNFSGSAVFGRLLADASSETEQLMKELNILEVPTFLFYRGGEQLGRMVGSSRGDLIGHILQHQQAAGITLPPPPARAPRPSRAQRPVKSAW